MSEPSAPSVPEAPIALTLGRPHARRLRDVHRSAGWPVQDALEVELLAAALLERTTDPRGYERVRLTGSGISFLAQALATNRQALSRHDALVARVAHVLLREGRIVWTGLSLRARLPDPPAVEGEAPPRARWKICRPDLFSIRNTTVPAYLESVVHEIKVSRADLLGDLRGSDKRDSYLDIGQCWYVLGRDAKGRPIAEADEVPAACGVLMAQADGRLDVARHAPKRAVPDLPFGVWMSLAKAAPLPPLATSLDHEPDQRMLCEPDDAP